MNIHTIILVSCLTNVIQSFVINSGRYHGLTCDTGFQRQEHFKPFLMTNSPSSDADEMSFRAEAERLRRQAKEIRDSLSKSKNTSVEVGGNRMVSATESLFRIPVKNADMGVEYRLDFDIGREAGTWMDPRWGASGKRIPWTLDVLFTSIQLSPEEERYKRIKRVYNNDAIVRSLEAASAGRLRQGFDSMPVYPGAYYVDVSDKGQTCRFVIPVDGTPERGGSFGDIFVPRSCLYVSLPCFGGVHNLSNKEGIVTVRQIGWHTGWRREESRIIGTVRATPIEKAIIRDKF